MKDLSCLADGYIVETNQSITGINANEIIVGGTGSGKTFSTVLPRLLHTYTSSVVIPLSKRKLHDQISGILKQRDYEVQVIDFSYPEKSNIGYDPLEYIKTDEDVVAFAKQLVMGCDESNRGYFSKDPYWDNSAISVVSAIISLAILNAKSANKKPTFVDVLTLYNALEYDKDDDNFSSSLDTYFIQAENLYPGNQASKQWQTLYGLGIRTASCILSTANNAFDKMFSKEIVALMKKEKSISFKDLSKQKTALFIVTSPINKTLKNYVNIMYSQMFKELFETAEKNEDGRLEIPVHIACDDFACGSVIDGFEDYISIFRAAGISVTLLLQSETQLRSIYGDFAASTIINNCDTYVYMGGMDYTTCHAISQKCDMSVNKLMNMKIGDVVVIRRGEKPVLTQRYQTLEDPIYKSMIANKRSIEISNEVSQFDEAEIA